MPKADVWIDLEGGLLHHKYAIVDVYATASDPLVITGSHNWTSGAESVNDENTLIIHCPDIANQFLQEFAQRYRAAGGRDDLRTEVESPLAGKAAAPEELALSFLYPNPFNEGTRVGVRVPTGRGATRPGMGAVLLALYDVRGQRVATLHYGDLAPGEHVFTWMGRDDQGRAVSSGVYLCVLEAEGTRTVRKVSLVR